MTRLEYMKLAPGRRRDVREHLAATRTGLNALQSSATFSDFKPAEWRGVGWAPTLDGTCRTENHHGVDPESTWAQRMVFTVTRAAPGSSWNRRRAEQTDSLFKASLSERGQCWGCGHSCKRNRALCEQCRIFVARQNSELRQGQRSAAKTRAKQLARAQAANRR